MRRKATPRDRRAHSQQRIADMNGLVNEVLRTLPKRAHHAEALMIMWTWAGHPTIAPTFGRSAFALSVNKLAEVAGRSENWASAVFRELRNAGVIRMLRKKRGSTAATSRPQICR